METNTNSGLKLGVTSDVRKRKNKWEGVHTMHSRTNFLKPSASVPRGSPSLIFGALMTLQLTTPCMLTTGIIV